MYAPTPEWDGGQASDFTILDVCSLWHPSSMMSTRGPPNYVKKCPVFNSMPNNSIPTVGLQLFLFKMIV